MNKDFTPEELLERIQRMYKHKKPEEQIIVLTETEYTRQVQTLVKAQVSVYESQGKLSSKGVLQKKIYDLEEQLQPSLRLCGLRNAKAFSPATL